MMLSILYALGLFAADLFKSRGRLQAENLFLRHQLNIALRRGPPWPRLRASDRVLLVWMTRICASLLDLAPVARPGNDPAVASRWLQGFLALEISE
jgi:hypothetical protein